MCMEDIDATYYVLPGTDRNFPLTLPLVIIFTDLTYASELRVFDDGNLKVNYKHAYETSSNRLTKLFPL